MHPPALYVIIRAMDTLLFVDDHPLYREGVRRAVNELLPDRACSLADRSASALQLLGTESEVDLLLSDYQLPDGNGLDLLRQVSTQRPSIARGLLCGAPDAWLARQARDQGCVACLSKERDLDGLGAAVTALLQGQTVFDVEPAPFSTQAAPFGQAPGNPAPGRQGTVQQGNFGPDGNFGTHRQGPLDVHFRADGGQQPHGSCQSGFARALDLEPHMHDDEPRPR